MAKRSQKSRAVYILSFTEKGAALADRLRHIAAKSGMDATCYTIRRFLADDREPMPDDRSRWIGESWGQIDFVFVGAAGIAIRMIAPCVRDKFTDSAVICADERGQYVIPLLSGHVGGGVRLAQTLADGLCAVNVVTTATDVRGKFAVDVFAGRHGLTIGDRQAAKRISAAALAQEAIAVYEEIPIGHDERPGMCNKAPDIHDEAPDICNDPGDTVGGGECGTASGRTGSVWDDVCARYDELVFCQTWKELAAYRYAVCITTRPLFLQKRLEEAGFSGCLLCLSPPVAAGVGCRRGIDAMQLRRQLHSFLSEYGYVPEQIRALASIDLKKDERALLFMADEWKIPFVTYTAGELADIRISSEPSEFVKGVTGVDNVCERAARICAMEKFADETKRQEILLLEPKKKLPAMTVSLAAVWMRS